MCERQDANRTREAGHLDEIQGAMANTLKLLRSGAVGFIDWLGLLVKSRIWFWQELDFRKYTESGSRH